MLLTKERIERAATENQFMNGKIKAIQVRAVCVGIYLLIYHVLLTAFSVISNFTECHSERTFSGVRGRT